MAALVAGARPPGDDRFLAVALALDRQNQTSLSFPLRAGRAGV